MTPHKRIQERLRRNRTDEMRRKLGLPAWSWQYPLERRKDETLPQ
jgi:hypothetical protein